MKTEVLRIFNKKSTKNFSTERNLNSNFTSPTCRDGVKVYYGSLTLIPPSVSLYGSQILLFKVLEVQMCY